MTITIPLVLAGATFEGIEQDLDHEAGEFALVYGDPDAARNGFYLKIGRTGLGEWERTRFHVRTDRVFVPHAPLTAGSLAVGTGLRQLEGSGNVEAGGNIAIGINAGDALVDGWGNTLTGFKSGESLSAKTISNSFGGTLGNTGNTFYGYLTAPLANGSLDCTLVGALCGLNLTTGMDLVGIGIKCMEAIEAASETVGVGHGTLQYVVGEGSLADIDTLHESGPNASWGHRITAVGDQAARFLNDRNNSKTKGKKSTYIGARTTSAENFAINENVFGYDAQGRGSNSFVYGDDKIVGHYFPSGGLFVEGHQTTVKFPNAFIDPSTGEIKRVLDIASSWIPVITGSVNGEPIATSALEAEYTRAGGWLWYTIHFTVDVVNTGTGAIRFTLPSVAARNDVVTGMILSTGQVIGGALMNSSGVYQPPFTIGQAGIYDSSHGIVGSGRSFVIGGKYRETA